MYSYSAFSNVLVYVLSYHQYTRIHENVLVLSYHQYTRTHVNVLVLSF